ncbi:unnamed protein product [Cunninghamella blakesleeana]
MIVIWVQKKAESWISKFNKTDIPKEHITVFFSRSSGPGGQNVNKANWIPEYGREKLKTSQYITKSGELKITSDKTRSQGKNLQECYEKLVVVIKQAVAVQREADASSISRIENRRKKENEKRIDNKQKHGQKKANRRIRNNDY